MEFKVLFVTASEAEAEVLDKIEGIKKAGGVYRLGKFRISQVTAGVGSVSTAWEMQKWLSVNEKPDLAINAGIAGSFRKEIGIGEVVMPVTDCFADAGVEDGDSFLTLAEAGLAGANVFPFNEGRISSDPRYSERLNRIIKPVVSITVNMATGSTLTRDKLVRKFNPDIETMEGATFFYICSREKIPFFALRAISNMVEVRNKANWNIKLALINLSGKLNEIILKL